MLKAYLKVQTQDSLAFIKLVTQDSNGCTHLWCRLKIAAEQRSRSFSQTQLFLTVTLPNTNTCSLTRTRTHTYIHTRTYTYTHTIVQAAHTHTMVQAAHTHIHTCTHRDGAVCEIYRDLAKQSDSAKQRPHGFAQPILCCVHIHSATCRWNNCQRANGCVLTRLAYAEQSFATTAASQRAYTCIFRGCWTTV